ncbi:Tetraspanin family [Popillia japonica]|uniref:Tetraspanin n=1 Tax=Popillia japonica TaxID=7064 RepID=A0AAW1KLD9_POPJA
MATFQGRVVKVTKHSTGINGVNGGQIKMTKVLRRDEGCCSVEFVKYVLHVFNVLFLVTGLGVLGIGLWTILDKYQYVTLLTSFTYPMLTYFLLAAGGLVLLVAILGFCAGCWEHRPLLLCYVFLLILIFLMEAMVGVFGFIYQEIVHTELENNLNNTFLKSYKEDYQKTIAIDFLQEKFQCCGAVSFSDWQYSQWKINHMDEVNLVPDSCCKTIKLHCGRRDHPSNINYSGCMQKMEDHLRNHLSILSAVGLGICVIQIFGVVYACMLFVKLKGIDDDT